MINVSDNSYRLPLYVMRFHNSKWIILTMCASVIIVCKVFQVGAPPSEAISAENQNAGTIPDRLCHRQPFLEIESMP